MVDNTSICGYLKLHNYRLDFCPRLCVSKENLMVRNYNCEELTEIYPKNIIDMEINDRNLYKTDLEKYLGFQKLKK